MNSEWIKELNIRSETLQFTGKVCNRYTIPITIGIGKDFLSRTPASQQPRERIDKCAYMKFRSFCTTKIMVSKLNRPPGVGENIC
jgi:hypothetical protein